MTFVEYFIKYVWYTSDAINVGILAYLLITQFIHYYIGKNRKRGKGVLGSTDTEAQSLATQLPNIATNSTVQNYEMRASLQNINEIVEDRCNNSEYIRVIESLPAYIASVGRVGYSSRVQGSPEINGSPGIKYLLRGYCQMLYLNKTFKTKNVSNLEPISIIELLLIHRKKRLIIS